MKVFESTRGWTDITRRSASRLLAQNETAPHTCASTGRGKGHPRTAQQAAHDGSRKAVEGDLKESGVCAGVARGDSRVNPHVATCLFPATSRDIREKWVRSSKDRLRDQIDAAIARIDTKRGRRSGQDEQPQPEHDLEEARDESANTESG